MVLALVLANVLAFFWELGLVAAEGRRALLEWAFVPISLSLAPVAAAITIFTSMFLHGGWMHLLGNLWFLWIFGPSVEAELGAKRFAALYLAGGAVAALAQAAFDPMGTIPMLGASGAIGAVLAAYVSLHPTRRIDTLFFIFVIPIPALFFVLEWFAMNLLRGLGSLSVASSLERAGGVAWWAHIGGFLGGLVLVRLLFPRAQPRPALGPRREVEVRGPSGEIYPVQTFHVRAPHDDDDRSEARVEDRVDPRRMSYGGGPWPNRWS